MVFCDRYIPGTRDGERPVPDVYKLADRSRIDGLCVDSSAFIGEADFDRFIAHTSGLEHLPIVLSSIAHGSIPSVFPDNAEGMTAILTHLHEVHGAVRIAYAGGSSNVEDSRTRRETWKDFADSRGLSTEGLEYAGAFDADSGRAAVRQLTAVKSNLPDAIVFANDEMAIGGMAELKARGLRIPEDILVTGFDNTMLSGIQHPPLTTAVQPIAEKARAAGQLLLNAINGYPSTGTVLRMDDLCREFPVLFPSISSSPAFVCLYDHEDPVYSHVIAASDGSGNSLVDANAPRRFHTTQIVPAYLLDDTIRRTLIVQGLRQEGPDFGFLVCEYENAASDIFVALRFQTSAALHNIMLIHQREADSLQLQKALETVAQSEQRYRELADLLPAFVMESSYDGRITYLNKRGLELLGLNPTSLTESKYLNDFLIDEISPEASPEYVQLKLRTPVRKEVSLLARKSRLDGETGTVRWIGLDFAPVIDSRLMPDDETLDRYGLTAREREILILELKGFSGKEIADQLSIALSTVKSHIGSMYRKLGVGSRDQLFTLMSNDTISTWGYDSLMLSLLSHLLRD
ncbi:MAG: substrate-binding domain-containing protein [Spirochaeta sp.]